jgi:hypothetical protein
MDKVDNHSRGFASENGVSEVVSCLFSPNPSLNAGLVSIKIYFSDLNLFHPVVPQQPGTDAPVISAAEAEEDSADIGPGKKPKKVKKASKENNSRKAPATEKTVCR